MKDAALLRLRFAVGALIDQSAKEGSCDGHNHDEITKDSHKYLNASVPDPSSPPDGSAPGDTSASPRGSSFRNPLPPYSWSAPTGNRPRPSDTMPATIRSPVWPVGAPCRDRASSVRETFGRACNPAGSGRGSSARLLRNYGGPPTDYRPAPSARVVVSARPKAER